VIKARVGGAIKTVDSSVVRVDEPAGVKGWANCRVRVDRRGAGIRGSAGARMRSGDRRAIEIFLRSAGTAAARAAFNE
jgi:hypothetical protein